MTDNSAIAFMRRCIQLANLGKGFVAPNPMVGSVLVHNETIIGEGYHKKFGQAHAEVNALNSVKEIHKPLIKDSTLLVSLEPCSHYGKTPPCADLIIRNQIPRVIVGCRDSYKEVNGTGIEKLIAAGIEVKISEIEAECRELNKSFFTFHNQKRPYIILKWAQTAYGIIGNTSNERLLISGETTNNWTHQKRSEVSAILVGTNTAVKDNPSLSNRLGTIPQPIRLIIDRTLKIAKTSHIYNGSQKTVIFNNKISGSEGNIRYVRMNNSDTVVRQVVQYCHDNLIQSLLVEGGSQTIQSFINENMWDEAIEIINPMSIQKTGIIAPKLLEKKLEKQLRVEQDYINIYGN